MDVDEYIRLKNHIFCVCLEQLYSGLDVQWFTSCVGYCIMFRLHNISNHASVWQSTYSGSVNLQTSINLPTYSSSSGAVCFLVSNVCFGDRDEMDLCFIGRQKEILCMTCNNSYLKYSVSPLSSKLTWSIRKQVHEWW